jgi:hypothetical protein
LINSPPCGAIRWPVEVTFYEPPGFSVVFAVLEPYANGPAYLKCPLSERGSAPNLAAGFSLNSISQQLGFLPQLWF